MKKLFKVLVIVLLAVCTVNLTACDGNEKDDSFKIGLICLHDEEIDFTQDLEIFDPNATWKRKMVTNYYVKELLVPIFINGEQVYENPSLEEIRNYCKEEVNSLWDEMKRLVNPHKYYVDLSQKLWDLKHEMLNNINK